MIREVPGGCELTVRVLPGSPRDQVVGEHGGALKVRVSAPPVEGAANERLIRFLSKEVLDLPRAAITIRSGEHGRSKVLRIEASEAVVRAAMERALGRA